MDINEILYNMKSSHNVVWRVSSLLDFQRILPSFILKAKNEKIPVCYIHFSENQIYAFNDTEYTLRSIELVHHFEKFSTLVYNAIEECSPNTFFVFDSLSELQTAWATDLMMENFFRVVTPMIIKSGGKAFFPLVRSMHSSEACEDILADTQIFIDLYSDFNNLFLSPVKIFDSMDLSDTWFFDDESFTFVPVDKEASSAFLRAVTREARRSQSRNKDSWERFFDDVQSRYQRGENIEKECERMSEIMMSRDPKIRDMLIKNFDPIDYFYVKEHMIGTGMIGGKACGMLIARKIIENLRPDIYETFEAHDSFFIGSDVFYSYIVDNNYWHLKVRQHTKEGYFSLAKEFAQKLCSGKFSQKMENEFIRVLNYYGNCPIIVRSSSMLEDGFGNAFAGKYQSVFCTGTGSINERLCEFENAIRVVYASTMDLSALDYRLRRNLNDKDEEMSLLVMRVSGSFYGSYFMPCAAGVGYSYSTYRFLKTLDPAAGMLRLVMGLGTSAVDRTEGSYPRLVSLDKPSATSFKNTAEHHKYSQRSIEVINTETSKLERISPDKIFHLLSTSVKSALFEHDFDAERACRDRGMRRDITFVSCCGIVRDKKLMNDIKDMMITIQKVYDHPVDIEFTINQDSYGKYMLNLLQCRPLAIFTDNKKTEIPADIPDENILLDCSGSSMGHSIAFDVDIIVYIDPIKYYEMPYVDKQQTAKVLGAVNWKLMGQNKKMILFSPGRIGTSSPELGVPTSYSDISEFNAVFEVAESKVGYNPELSYGSHMFQDLVENNILYAAIFENKTRRIFSPGKLKDFKNELTLYTTTADKLTDVVGVYNVSEASCRIYHDMINEHLICTLL